MKVALTLMAAVLFCEVGSADMPVWGMRRVESESGVKAQIRFEKVVKEETKRGLGSGIDYRTVSMARDVEISLDITPKSIESIIIVEKIRGKEFTEGHQVFEERKREIKVEGNKPTSLGDFQRTRGVYGTVSENEGPITLSIYFKHTNATLSLVEIKDLLDPTVK